VTENITLPVAIFEHSVSLDLSSSVPLVDFSEALTVNPVFYHQRRMNLSALNIVEVPKSWIQTVVRHFHYLLTLLLSIQTTELTSLVPGILWKNIDLKLIVCGSPAAVLHGNGDLRAFRHQIGDQFMRRRIVGDLGHEAAITVFPAVRLVQQGVRADQSENGLEVAP
jgi:hypothetical protein